MRFPGGFRDDRGATAVEYGLIVALIAVVILGAVVVLGGSVGGLFGSAANASTGLTVQGDDGQCAGKFYVDPVTCDPDTGLPDTSACPGLAEGDGTAGFPWACVADVNMCEGEYWTAPVTCDPATGVDTSMCTNGTTGDGSQASPWACAAASPYSGPTPNASYSYDIGNDGSYALPSIPGIQYALGACSNQDNGGCGKVSLVSNALKVNNGWGSAKATQTVTWSIPATGTSQAASGSFTVRLT